MPGRSMSLLTAAAFWVLVPAAAQAQDEAAELPDGEGDRPPLGGPVGMLV